MCLAGKHTGIIRNPGDLMLWTVENGGNSVRRKAKISDRGKRQIERGKRKIEKTDECRNEGG